MTLWLRARPYRRGWPAAGRDGGTRSLVLLCVAADERAAPHVDRAAIGMVSSEEWLVATPTWLEGVA